MKFNIFRLDEGLQKMRTNMRYFETSESESEDVTEYVEENSEDEIKARLNQKREAMGDDFNLKKVFDHEKEPKAYDPMGNKAGFVLVLMYLTIYTIFMTQVTFRTNDAYQVSKSIRTNFETYPMDESARTYDNIVDKDNIFDFLNDIVIKQIFDETINKFASYQEGYHYINSYNYFAGMRITHNRVDLKTYTRDSLTDHTRRRDYKGRTNQRFLDINTDYFEFNNKSYSHNGGYFGMGGFIYYLTSNTTYEEASAFVTQAYNSSMFDEEFLTLTFEIMFYNQNLETGVLICYEFLNNNAAIVESNVFVDSFFISAYSDCNNVYSNVTKIILIVCDIIWVI